MVAVVAMVAGDRVGSGDQVVAMVAVVAGDRIGPRDQSRDASVYCIE